MAKRTRLLLFDYDGVLVVPHPTSFAIMREAVSLMINTTKMPDWNAVFQRIVQEKRGTTELNFLTAVAAELHIPVSDQGDFFNRFYKVRSTLVELNTLQRKREKFDDDYYYEDALKMIEREKIENADIQTIIGIVTGNPREVMNKRLPAVLEKYVDFIVGGDEGMTRKELQQIALKRAEDLGFKPWMAANEHRINNAFYFDDVAQAVIGGMEVGLQPVYVMREGVGELAMQPVEASLPILTKALADQIATHLQENETSKADGKPMTNLSLFLSDAADPDPRMIFYAGMKKEIATRLTYQITEESARRNMIMVNSLDDSRLSHFLKPRTHLPSGEGSIHHRHRNRAEQK